MERKNKITELVFILDRSGSMAGLESDTIGGFNAMIAKQRKQSGECYISTVLFDNRTEVLHDRVRLDEIKPMTDVDYTVRGCTALLVTGFGLRDSITNVVDYQFQDVTVYDMAMGEQSMGLIFMDRDVAVTGVARPKKDAAHFQVIYELNGEIPAEYYYRENVEMPVRPQE